MKTRRSYRFLQIFTILSAYLLIFPSCKSDEVITCDPDIYEANNSFAVAYSLGNVVEEVKSYSARISSEDDLDFFKITATEGSHIGVPYTAQYFRATFELILPSGVDYDLYIYNETGTLAVQSTERGDVTEVVELDWEGAFLFDDSSIFGIEVRPYAGDWDCDDYILIITMLYSDSPW